MRALWEQGYTLLKTDFRNGFHELLKSLWSLCGDSADFGIFHRSPHTLCVGSHPLGSCLQSYSKHW